MINFANQSVIVAIVSAIFFALLISIPSLQKLFDRAMRLAATIARTPALCLVVVFAIALIVAALPSIIFRSIPVPYVHDEFSYLLAGDTFSHFRLTNPPHALWKFFDTMHVLQQPTYMSKFPVGQGFALAVGFWLGLPIAGVWLSTATACAAMTWTLRAFVPPRWALIGGIVCAFHPLVAWWTQGYWGGSVAMIGGAILLGAAGRAMRRRSRFAHGILFGIGLAILANSRPLEGLLLAILLAIWMRRALLRVALPALLVLAPTFAFMGYYNWRVTGSAITLPYALHAKQYMIAPIFFGQHENAVHPYTSKTLEDFFVEGEPREYRAQLRWNQHLLSIAYKWWTLLKYFFNPMILALPMLVMFWKDRRQRTIVLIFLALPTIHMLLTPWLRSAYMAPLMGILFVGITSGLRIMSRSRLGRSLAVLVIFATIVANVAWAKDLNDRARVSVAVERATLVKTLRATGGKHLVIVHYGPYHHPNFEFVYNHANIDDADVVFARSLGDDADRALLDYFKNRKVWDLYYDDGPYSVTPRK